MKKIGITGGIGSGKSTVCRIFEMLGVPVFYADEEAKKLYTENEDLKAEIIKLFGPISYVNNQFNKSYIASIVFNNTEKLNQLNALVHPLAIAKSTAWMNMHSNSAYVLKEAAVLIESKSYTQLDSIIYVSSPEALRIKRVMQRENINEEEVMKRIKNQMPEEEKIKYAHYIIHNNETELLIPQVLLLHKTILEKATQK